MRRLWMAVRERAARLLVRLGLYQPEKVMYIGGSDTLPSPLTREEEGELIARLGQGDPEARDVLIQRNLRLVAHIVKKYYTQSADQEDLISIGTIGLIKGITSFDPEKGARLATYAARCIENEILMYFRSQKKLQGEISLSDSIDTDKEGNALQLMDVVGVDDTMLEDLHDRDTALQLRRLIDGHIFDHGTFLSAPAPAGARIRIGNLTHFTTGGTLRQLPNEPSAIAIPGAAPCRKP